MTEQTISSLSSTMPQPDSVRAVQSRINELRSRLGLPGAPAAVLGGRSTAFADTLDVARAATGTDRAAGSITAAATGAALLGAARPAVGSPAVAGPSGRPSGDLGQAAIALARKSFGVPYVWGGEDLARGVDCSGLVQSVYGKLGIDMPRVAADQSRAGVAVPSLAKARPGDLVFFGSPATHVGIYAGDGKMIDAPRRGKTVGLHDLWGTPSAIRRVVPESPAAAPGAGGTVAVAAVAAEAPSATGASAVAGPYGSLFTAAGRRHGVDPALLSAVAKAESGYNPRAVSPAGAQGLMQLMPGTARSLGAQAFEPASAVDGAARLLSDLLDTFDGRVDLALAGYNAGPGAVRKYGGIPPYTETQNYVRRVTGYWKDLS